jgi:L-lactate dehydrogenase complex protein LldE
VSDRTVRPTRVGFWPTCMSDLAAPGPALAALEVLRAMGFDPVVPANAGCCGQPAFNTGRPRAAAPVLRHTIDAFEGCDAVVTVAGSCAAMVAHNGPALVPAASGFAGRLWEFSQFVAAFGADLRLRLDATVTYHEGCHMTRVLGEHRSPRELLARIERLRLVEMVDADGCCGFGGTFAVKFPGLSAAMADVKLDHAAATAVDWIVSADPGCLMHLGGRAGATGRALRTRHIAEIVRDALVPAVVTA